MKKTICVLLLAVLLLSSCGEPLEQSSSFEDSSDTTETLSNHVDISSISPQELIDFVNPKLEEYGASALYTETEQMSSAKTYFLMGDIFVAITPTQNEQIESIFQIIDSSTQETLNLSLESASYFLQALDPTLSNEQAMERIVVLLQDLLISEADEDGIQRTTLDYGHFTVSGYLNDDSHYCDLFFHLND